MTIYRASLPYQLIYDRDAIDALIGLGGIDLTYTTEWQTRRQAVVVLGDEFAWRNLDREFWDKHLSGRRK